MKNRLYLIMAILLAVLLMPGFALAKTVDNHYLGPNSIEKIQYSGQYTIYVFKDGTWQKAGSFKCDKFFRDQNIDLSKFLPVKGPVQITPCGKGR